MNALASWQTFFTIKFPMNLWIIIFLVLIKIKLRWNENCCGPTWTCPQDCLPVIIKPPAASLVLSHHRMSEPLSKYTFTRSMADSLVYTVISIRSACAWLWHLLHDRPRGQAQGKWRVASGVAPRRALQVIPFPVFSRPPGTNTWVLGANMGHMALWFPFLESILRSCSTSSWISPQVVLRQAVFFKFDFNKFNERLFNYKLIRYY